jgi:hypothetical protein
VLSHLQGSIGRWPPPPPLPPRRSLHAPSFPHTAQVVITTDTTKECTHEVLPITYPKFPAMCEVRAARQLRPTARDHHAAASAQRLLPLLDLPSPCPPCHTVLARRAACMASSPSHAPTPHPTPPSRPPPRRPACLQPGDQIFLGRYLVTGADESSVFLRVEQVTPTEVTCTANSAAVLDGLLTVFHLERSNGERVLGRGGGGGGGHGQARSAAGLAGNACCPPECVRTCGDRVTALRGWPPWQGGRAF